MSTDTNLQTNPLDVIDRQISGLHAVREFLSDRPELAEHGWLYHGNADTVSIWLHPGDFGYGNDTLRLEWKRCARVLARGSKIGEVRKDADDRRMKVTRNVGGIDVQLIALRENVCELVVTGTETVEIPAREREPARTEIRDVTEWRCDPILNDGGPA